MPETPMSQLSLDALQVAKSQLGVTEEKNNTGPKVTEYLKAVGLHTGYSWCAAFVYWCWEQAAENLKVPNPLIKTAGVLNHWNLTKGMKVKVPKAGDIFIIRHTATNGHTGMVKTVDPIARTYTTVEGNSNNTGSREGTEVCTNTRKIADAFGFIRY